MTDGDDSSYPGADNTAAAMKAPTYASNVAGTGKAGLGTEVWTVGMNPPVSNTIPTRMTGLAMDFKPTYYPYTGGIPASSVAFPSYSTNNNVAWNVAGNGPTVTAGGVISSSPVAPGSDTYQGQYYYGKTDPSWLNTPIAQTNYYHCITGQDAIDAFAAFGAAVAAFENPKINIQNNTQAFSVYQMPGQPMFTYTGPNQTEAFLSGGNVRWEFPGGIESNELYTVSYYVKMADNLDPKLSYPVILGSTVDYEFDNQSYNITFPLAYISPGGAIEKDDTAEGMTEAAGKDGFTGMDGHQENRDNAKTTVETMGYSPDSRPIGMTVKAGTAPSGRAKAIIEVENGSLMRFQWQVKTEAGAWEDIFGATSSQYTLNPNQFKAGKSYTLRCLVTNPAGTVTTSAELTITASAAAKSGSLQSK